LLQDYDIPAWAAVLDAGTSVRELLVDIVLSDVTPDVLVIVDAVDVGRRAGELLEVDLDALPSSRRPGLSLHQAPSAALLREIRSRRAMEVRVLACQVSELPELLSEGLSEAVMEAVDPMCRTLWERFLSSRDHST
jgi:coenzyme F420 hydrogenase subunit delta